MFKKYSDEIKAGIIVISGLLILVWGINFLKGIGLFSNQREFYAIYQNVDGLLEANPVQLNGMQIGNVRSVDFMPGNSGRILVGFLISKDVFIPENTVARIISSNLMNAKAIELVLGNSQSPAESGDTLVGDLQLTLGQEVNRQVAPIKEKAESMLSSLDSVLMVFQNIFNAQTRNNLSQSFVRIQNALSALEHASFGVDTLVTVERKRLKEILSNVESITRNLKNNNETLTAALTNIQTISDSLAKSDLKQTIEKAGKVFGDLGFVVEKINRGEGSLGLLVNNDSLYNNLNAASRDLDSLLIDLKANPNRYVQVSVFGKKNKKN